MQNIDTIIFKLNNRLDEETMHKYGIDINTTLFEKSGVVKYNYNKNVLIRCINKYENIIITSQNTAQILIKYSKLIELKKNFLIVGKLTSSMIKQKFPNSNIIFYENIATLLKKISNDTQYLYLRGKVVKTDLSKLYSNVFEYHLYRVCYFSTLSYALIKLLRNKELSFTIYAFSRKSEERLIKIMQKYSLKSKKFLTIRMIYND